MRLSTDDDRNEERAVATIAAALDAGITVFDTAHAYGLDAHDRGHNEALLARALRRGGAHDSARIVTKGGMTRSNGRWLPDGRARAIRSDCEASLLALDGLPIDVYLLHAPDPRTPWRTSVRALARLVTEGLVHRVGVSNVNRQQLEEALAIVPVAAVQVALSVLDDSAVRGGLVERCADTGIAVIAHSPLGGARRASSVARNAALVDLATARGVGPAEMALAWLLDLSPNVIAIPGARRPETARSAAHAARLALDVGERAAIRRAFGGAGAHRVGRSRPSVHDGDVVLVMGIPGAGKSRATGEYVARGYVRLNRDERGGSLRDLSEALDTALADGARRVVLDNTWLTRASRSRVIDVAGRHGMPARCLWLDTPLAQAQYNLVLRLLDRFGHLPAPDEVVALSRQEPGLLMPTSQMRTVRELEPPAVDEGFSSVERVPFVRLPAAAAGLAGGLVASAAVTRPGWDAALARSDRTAPHLVFDWQPDSGRSALGEAVTAVAAAVSGVVEGALCPHPAGPPACWCRPPLPGLALAFARRHGVDLSRSVVIGTGPAHRTLATALGAALILV